jgi:hypothetical protein
MRIIRSLSICLAAALLSGPLVYAQDLSQYRTFSLGSTLNELSVQVNAKPADATVTHPAPALIQELIWWPVKSYETSAPSDTVQVIQFSFYNAGLYRIMVTYENSATQGLSPEDMVRALSAKYGVATLPAVQTNLPASASYSSSAQTVAVWEDSQYSVTLSHFTTSNIFQLVMFSKQLNGQADAAIALAVQQARADAPQREIARAKQEAEDQEALRQANLKSFRP